MTNSSSDTGIGGNSTGKRIESGAGNPKRQQRRRHRDDAHVHDHMRAKRRHTPRYPRRQPESRKREHSEDKNNLPRHFNHIVSFNRSALRSTAVLRSITSFRSAANAPVERFEPFVFHFNNNSEKTA
jgi:hypothetical protein